MFEMCRCRRYGETIEINDAQPFFPVSEAVRQIGAGGDLGCLEALGLVQQPEVVANQPAASAIRTLSPSKPRTV